MAANDETEVECCVCLGSIADACRAPCKHSFCRQCILQVLGMMPPEWSGLCPLCRSHVSVYNLRDASGTRLAKPDMRSLYGCIFVQGGGLGVASYHFDGPEDCYISYANAPASWRDEDGSMPPEKKPWLAPNFDAETLTFRGVIEWDPAFHGDQKWEYEVVFSEDFSGVVGGKVVCHSLEGRMETDPFKPPWEVSFDRSLAYLRWTPPPSTIFGSVYVQGLVYAPMLEGIASYHFDAEDSCYISYTRAPESWKLDDGTSPPGKKFFLHPAFEAGTRTFRGVVEWEITFGGAARWEYEMVFAEDFGSIVGGRMQPYGPTGRKLPVTSFTDPARGAHTSAMCYVQKPGALVSGARALAEASGGASAGITSGEGAERE